MGALLLTLIAGVAAGTLAARQMVRREIETLREELRSQNGQPAPVPVAAKPPPSAGTVKPAAAPPEISKEITPEILMVLTAAVAAFLGKKAKIKRARLAPTHQGSAWAQQGRVFVQASHNLPHR
jgi:methylmalonyl-CoA carboxyltransferase large subunit